MFLPHQAIAQAIVRMQPLILRVILDDQLSKGDDPATAQIAAMTLIDIAKAIDCVMVIESTQII